MLEADRKQIIVKAAQVHAECVVAYRGGNLNAGMVPASGGGWVPAPFVAMRENGPDGSTATTITTDKNETILLLIAEERELERLSAEALEKLAPTPKPPVPEPMAPYYTAPSNTPLPQDPPSTWSQFKGMVLKLFGRG